MTLAPHIPIKRNSRIERSAPTLIEPSLGRQLPCSPDAEKCVLGSMLIRNEVFFRVSNLTTEHFFIPANRIIFGMFALMVEEGVTDIEPVSMRLELLKHGLLEEAGGVAYISALLDMVPDIANVERYAKIVERMAKKRAAILAGWKMAEDSFDPETEPEEVAAAAMAALSPVATREEQQARNLILVMSDALDAQERRATGQMDDIALRSGYAGLDEVRAIKRSFTIIGAPSEAGKTAHLTNLLDGLSMNGHPCALFTLESSEEEVALRYASMKAGVPHAFMQDWKLMGDGDMRRLKSLRSDAPQGAPMFITRRLRTIEEIVLEARRLRAVEGIDAILIDYIQRVRAKGFRPTEKEPAMAHVAETLLDTALDLNIGVIAASQLRDDWQKRENGRLVKEDLKYARALGETARVVLMFHRPRAVDKSNRDLKWCQVVYQIEKNSENRTHDPDMHFDESTQRFTDGTCEQNNCRSRAGSMAERGLFS